MVTSPQPTPSPVQKDAKEEKRAVRLTPDEIIGDRYRVIEVIGEGGMGVVYRVEHVHMRKLFALKVLHPELLRMPEVVSRFEREAVLAGSINHPNVAAATDFGKLPDGSFFLVLELVVGKSLRALIAEGPLEATRALAIMRGMAAGVAAAHAKGIVHRDLKPDNVMLVERDGVPDFVKVLDFGIAKGDAMPEARDSDVKQLTQIGAIMGTPDYMSPEQAVGQAVDARSDLYSLGVIYFELLTGAPPFHGDALQVLRHHLMTEPAAVPAERVAGVGVPLGEIVARLLAKEPEARVQTAAELLVALDGAGAGAGAGASASASASASAGAGESTRGTSEAREDREDGEAGVLPRRVVVGAAALGVLVLVVVVVAILVTRREPVAVTDGAGMVQVAGPQASAMPPEAASSAADDDTAPATNPSASASGEEAEAEAEGPTPPAASGARSGAAPPAAAPARRAGKDRRRSAPRKGGGVLAPFKALFKR